jgi:hypothetical protein
MGLLSDLLLRPVAGPTALDLELHAPAFDLGTGVTCPILR